MNALRNYWRIDAAVVDRCRTNASYLEDLLLGDEEGVIETFDTDQAWDAIHFLISANRAYPDQENQEESRVFDIAILGSKIHKGLDTGFGPAGVLTPSEVAEVAAALKDLSEEEMRERFDPEAMDTAEVYPEIWKSEGDDAWEYVWEHLQRLREFYDRAAAEGSGVVTWITPPLHIPGDT